MTTSQPNYRHEAEVRAYVATLASPATGDKESTRRVLMARKAEALIAHRDALKKDEKRALALMKRADYADVRPVLVHCGPDDKTLWRYVYATAHSSPTAAFGRPGRSNRLFCLDQRSGAILGVLEIGSDVQSLGPRDRFIGWDKGRKFGGGLNHSGNVGVCLSVAPFGLLTGGKFMIEATTTTLVTDLWTMRYGEPIAIVVVTSLYGRSSLYNRLPSFSYLGDTPGQGTAHVTSEGLVLLKRFIEDNGLRTRTGGVGLIMDNKSDYLERACAALKIDRASIASNQPRGVYVALLGAKSLPFLRGEAGEFLPIAREQAAVQEWWRERWYEMRLPKVSAQIAAFDFDSYRVDNQIDICRSAVGA
jgi:hypothetical protein